MPGAQKGIEFLASWLAVSESYSLLERLDQQTYKRLQKSSMVCMTPYESSTMRHMLVKGNFFHNEFGINAGLCSLSCLPTLTTKTGISNRLMVNIAMTFGCWI